MVNTKINKINSYICACIYWWNCRIIRGISRRHYSTAGLNRSLGSQEVQPPRNFIKLEQEGGKIDSPRHRPLLSPGHTHSPNICQTLSGPHEYSLARKIKSMKNPNDPIGNRNRNLPACNTVLQPTATMGILEPIQLLNWLCGVNTWKEVSTVQLTDGEIKRREA